MSRTSRIAALVLGLLLVLGVGSILGYLGYCKYHHLYSKIDSTAYAYNPSEASVNLAKHRDGAQLYDQFRGPCIGCIVLGLGLIALAIFRKPPRESAPQPAVPIDPLAD